ncbi:hypothetical protein [Psychrobacillus antarcticus]|uniref:hypothetical protein n=1 Tax=Psychrobacillus antarcticus TaxID=2879115 RepID=UPI00240836B4|nr:hypothetical protein [Psychrobacillus antarcticus]
MEMVVHELNRLVEDYNKCPDLLIKEQILIDIDLLKEALLLSNINFNFKLLDNL